MAFNKKDLYTAQQFCTPTEVAMLNCLFIHKDRCGQMQVSREKLQMLSGLSRDKARKATKLLQQKGLLHIRLVHFNGKQRDSIYTLQHTAQQ